MAGQYQTRIDGGRSEQVEPQKQSGKGFELQVIRTSKSFEHLFEGFAQLQAVSYVADAGAILRLFETVGLKRVEFILGETFTDFRENLDADSLSKLCSLIESGALIIRSPRARKTIHSKLYILSGEGNPRPVRIIHGSRNFAQSGSIDSVAVYDVVEGSPTHRGFVDHYSEHLAESDPYLEDLMGLLRDDPTRRTELIEAFLQREEVGDTTAPTVLFQPVTARALDAPEQTLLTLELPKSKRRRQEAERFLQSVRPNLVGDRFEFGRKEYLGLLERTVGLPIMNVDLARGSVRAVIGGEVIDLARPWPTDPSAIAAGLAHLESYVDTISAEPSPADVIATQQAGMFEGLLYLFTSPFLHEHMKVRREKIGVVNERGPRYLMITGPTHNGKSTFLKFAMKMLTGRAIKALSVKDFKEGTLRTANSIGTVFPLVFDDLVNVTDQKFETIIKTYWEKRWTPESPAPQLVFAVNKGALLPWGKSRIKRIIFPVPIQATASKQENLQRILLKENFIFCWFASRYMQLLGTSHEVLDDELALARRVMAELYTRAGRTRPKYFLDLPVESVFDTGPQEWRTLFNDLHKATWVREGARVKVEFKEEIGDELILFYLSLLPQTIHQEKRGRTVVIQPPDYFEKWLGFPSSRPAGRKGIFSRWFGGSAT